MVHLISLLKQIIISHKIWRLGLQAPYTQIKIMGKMILSATHPITALTTHGHTHHTFAKFLCKKVILCVCWCHFMNTTAQLESQLHCFLFLYPASAIMHAVIITISKIIAFNNIIIDHSSTWSMLIKVMGMSNILSLLYAWLQSSPCERIATFIPYVNNSVRSSNLYTL